MGALCITDLIAELLTGTPWVVSLIYALALTGDAVLSSWLILHFVGESITFRRVREVVGWLLLSVILSNALVSLVAAAASHLLPGTSFWNSWKWWAASDGIGNLLVTPLILSWAAWGRTRLEVWNPKRVLEGAALFILLTIFNYIAFNYLSEQGLFSLLVTYLTFPFLLYAALRFGVHGVASVLVILAEIAIYFAAAGRLTNVLLQSSPLDIVITLQLYLAIMAVPALFLAAGVTESRWAEGALKSSQALYHDLVETAQDLIWQCDAEGRYIYLNPAWEEVFGYKKEEMLGKRFSDFQTPEYAERDLKEFARLTLINDVLDISKIEAGQVQILRHSFDMRSVIEQALRAVIPLAAKKGISLDSVIAPDVGPIISDQRRVTQILINLLNNAVKFTERGTVRISARRVRSQESGAGRQELEVRRKEEVSELRTQGSELHGNFVEISVADNGIGIKPEYMDKLFKPFSQIETGLTRNYEGTDLGLSICRKLVEMLGGTIRVESEWKKGSTFTFTLPL